MVAGDAPLVASLVGRFLSCIVHLLVGSSSFLTISLLWVWLIDWGENYLVNQSGCLAVILGLWKNTADPIEEFVARGDGRTCFDLVCGLAPNQNFRGRKTDH